MEFRDGSNLDVASSCYVLISAETTASVVMSGPDLGVSLKNLDLIPFLM